MAASAYGHHHAHSQTHRGPSIAAPNIPAGTFPPGTLLTVGAHKCTIDRYLSEGGFAHVYLVTLAQPVNGLKIAVLKRVAVPDKEALASMRTEVETMKRLKGHRHIVTYIDSHASHLKGGGYEVFLLMEYCSGGGLIDFMNTRLQHRLTEPEVLKIFDDVTEGVACMHYLQPPLLHRDLKVENVLIAPNGRYKLCDFGSCSAVKPAPQTVVECRLLEEDIQKHTTLQYRSPEMVDVYRRLPVDEKSDVWALGVLLYKLCYYTTPFEEHGQLAILNAKFSFPPYPAFSDRLKKLIASMLRESPEKRPNIFQIVQEVCHMRGKEVPIKDIYTNIPLPQQASRTIEKQLPSLPVQSPPSIIAYQAPVIQPEQNMLPEIIPMRRGRPSKTPAPTSTPHSAATSQTRVSGRSPQIRPSASDPFAALDGRPPQVDAPAPDDISSRFPSVEQFSLLHDSGNKFQFGEGNLSPSNPQIDFNDRVAEKLAEDAFGTSPPKFEQPPSGDVRAFDSVSRGVTGSGGLNRPVLYEPQPNRPIMVSTGTMTSPSPSPSPTRYESPPKIQELTAQPSNSTRERASETYVANMRQNQPQLHQRPTLLEAGRSTSNITRATSSSRPSLEATRTSLAAMDITSSIQPTRSKSANSRPRPHSVFVESNLEFLRDLDSPSSQGPSTGGIPPLGLRMQNSGNSMSSQQSDHIESNVDYLRAMEAEADANKPEKRSVSGGFVGKHVKRASMPSISLPKGPKNKLGGKFGDAFRRFERNAGGTDPARTPSPESNALMPTISGSHGASDGGDEWEVSSQEVPPEVKRELEKRQLAQEEQRVAAAAAEYKRQVANRDGDGSRPPTRTRANSIQKRVHTLLSENNSTDPPKTAEGYGRYTAEPTQQQVQQVDAHQDLTGSRSIRGESYRIQSYTRKDNTGSSSRPTTAMEGSRPIQRIETARPITSAGAQPMKIVRKPVGSSTASGTSPVITQSGARPPNPPPKPNKLRTGGSTVVPTGRPATKRSDGDLLGLNGGRGDGPGPADEDWEKSFAKRYPSLSGLEMVETVVASGSGRKS